MTLPRDLPFGRLNPMIDNFAPNKGRYNLSDPSFLNSVREGVKDRFTPDVLAGNTEYKAITLKVLPDNANGGTPHWLFPAFETLGAKTSLIRVIARIPELHAHLPLPRDDDDSQILGMYPTFEGASFNGKPNPGQIIRVTYQNIYNLTGPVYLGTLTAEGGGSVIMGTNNQNGAQNANESGPGTAEGGSGQFSTTRKLIEFGGWSGARAVNSPEKTLSQMQFRRVNHVDVMINDASRGAVEKINFHMYNRDKIIAMAKLFQANGIGVSFSTWACPTADWVKGMQEVGKLATLCNVDGVTLDLEEAWISPLKRKKITPEVISLWTNGLYHGLRSTYKGRIGVAPIVYSSQKVLDPMFALVDYIIPQCYATTKNTANLKRPGDLERLTMARYRKYGKEIIMGQASWNLENAYHLGNPMNAIRASLTSTLELGIYKVRYWRLEMMNDGLLQAMQEFL